MSDAAKSYPGAYLPLFQELEERLRNEKWFTEEWATSLGEYPGGIALQLSKANWFNEAGNGIHFETWMNQAEIKRRTVPVVLHVETAFPKKKRAFLHRFLERAGELLASWEGYTVSMANSMQPFICRLPLSEESLASDLVDEFSRLQQLVPIIDRTIQDAPK